MNPPTPIRFALSADEARIGATRAAISGALAGGLMNRHVAPLVAFVLLLAFVAILAFTGLMRGRLAEVLILLAGAAFMIQRLFTRRRFFRAQREARKWADAAAAAGEILVRLDDDGLAFENPALARRWRFADAREYEDAGGMVYLWPKNSGPPAFFPARAFADEAEAARWRGFARAHIAPPAPAAGEDDD